MESSNTQISKASFFDPFAGPSIEKVIRCTSAQREVWTAARFCSEASCAYNESVTLTLVGALNLESLRRSVANVLQRHDSLRAAFSADGETMCVFADPLSQLEYFDLSTLDESMRRDKITHFLEQEVSTPFHLEKGPLIRLTLIATSKVEYRLVITAHHSILDGWSTGILVKELATLYSDSLNGTSRLAPAEQFSQYAAIEREHERTKQFENDALFWKGMFSSIPETMELPIDFPRTPFRSYSSKRKDAVVSAETVRLLKQASLQYGSSLFTTLFTAFSIFLYRLTGQRDLVIGIPVAGQASSGLPSVIGHCVNTLPVRIQVVPAATLDQQMSETKGLIRNALSHQRYTFGTLLQHLSIERPTNRPALVSVLFNLDQALPASSLNFVGLECRELTTNPRLFETFEIFLNVVQRDGELVLECQYNSDLFSECTIERRLGEFIHLLEAIPTSGETPVSALPLVPPEEQRLLHTFGDGPQIRDHELLDFDLLLRKRVTENPGKIALIFGDQSRTYAELDGQASCISRSLHLRGVKRGERVGIFLDRGIEYVETVLGISRLGCVYVPIDPNHPLDRIDYVLRDANINLVVSTLELGSRLSSVQILSRETMLPSSGHADFPRESSWEPYSPLYVIYTSGSTGQPKGVVVSRRSASNFVLSMHQRPGICSTDVCLSVTTPAFDIWFLETFAVLTAGGTTVIADSSQIIDGHELSALIERHNISLMQATPYTWQLLVAAGWQNRSMRVLCGGEALPYQLMQELLARSREVWNMYGPTETTIWSTCRCIEADDKVPLIGEPIHNTRIAILDSELRSVPIGSVGELYIGGAGLALEYLGRKELTESAFVTIPTLEGTYYKTGDLARFTFSGSIECLGRRDSQIKYRGYRIELEEIESALTAAPGVVSAAVALFSGPESESRLVAYLVPKPNVSLRTDEVKARLESHLPRYMIPSQFIVVNELPLSPNGKVDRRMLSLNTAKTVPLNVPQRFQPESLQEKLLEEVWKELVGAESISVNDTFFNIGGHSLLAMKMIAIIKKKTGVSLSPRSVLMNTLRQLATELDIDSQPKQEQSLWNTLKRALVARM